MRQHHPGAQQPVVGAVQHGHVDAVAGGATLHQPGDPDGIRQQGRGISLERKVETHHRRSLETHGIYLPTRPAETGATLEVTNWLGQNPSPGWLFRAASEGGNLDIVVGLPGALVADEFGLIQR